MPGIVAGVDGGNSGTRALVVDHHGAVLGYAQAGNANHQSEGVIPAITHIYGAVSAACASASVALQCLDFVHFAVAGHDTLDDHTLLSGELAARLPGVPFGLSNDVWAGLRAGALTGVGIAVNCGSGCGAVGRNTGGNTVIIPDVGYMYGDSGGGSQIAIDAVRAVIRAWDGRGEPTALTEQFLDLAGLPDVASLYMALYRGQVSSAQLRKCTKLVLLAAARGDTVAAAILHRVGDELGLSGAAVARRLGMQSEQFQFVLTGGVFRTLDSPLALAAIGRIKQTAPHCKPTLPQVMPVAGAALQALESAGIQLSEDLPLRLAEQGYGWHKPESLAAE